MNLSDLPLGPLERALVVDRERQRFDRREVQIRHLLDVPLLILRGELSDILARPAGERMAAELPRARLVEVPGVGHAPTMDEPQARAAIDAWVAELPQA